MTLRGIIVAMLVCAALTPHIAAAQELGEIDPETDAQVAFRRGQSKFQRGHYSGAYDSFREAYELDPRPELLYNIGESAYRADMLPEALESFEAYLEEVSDVHPRRRGIERRVVEIREAIARGEGSDDAGPAPWIIAGLGAASTITGGILLGVGIDERSKAESADPGTPPAEVEEQRSRGNTLAVTGIVMLTVGALALAGGLYWGITSGSPDDDEADGEVEVEAGVVPGGVVLRGRF